MDPLDQSNIDWKSNRTTQSEVAHNLLIKDQRKITNIVDATGAVAPRTRTRKSPSEFHPKAGWAKNKLAPK